MSIFFRPTTAGEQLERAVIEAAAAVRDGYWEDNGFAGIAYSKLGAMQTLANAVDAWRDGGGTTGEEQAEDAA